ncbi:putative hydrolase [Klebsiella aerogenes]|nr:putative hydrolase [Klebsiella aerogenes]
MVEIIPTDMTPPENDSREFHPMRGVGNRHLQTMLPRLIRRKLRFTRTGSALSCRTAILSIWPGAKTRIRRAISRASSSFMVSKEACTARTPMV